MEHTVVVSVATACCTWLVVTWPHNDYTPILHEHATSRRPTIIQLWHCLQFHLSQFTLSSQARSGCYWGINRISPFHLAMYSYAHIGSILSGGASQRLQTVQSRCLFIRRVCREVMGARIIRRLSWSPDNIINTFC